MRARRHATPQLAAAVAERTELLAEEDARLMGAIADFRKKLASPDLTDDELRQAAKVIDESRAALDQRLELMARETDTVARIVAAARLSPDESVDVLRLQAVKLDSLAVGLRVSVEILKACGEVAELKA